jgi:hypothetical protein
MLHLRFLRGWRGCCRSRACWSGQLLLALSEPLMLWRPLIAAAAQLLELLGAGEWPTAQGRRECLATFDRDFVPLLPSRQLLLLEG